MHLTGPASGCCGTVKKVSLGGAIGDFALPSCAEAVMDLRREHGIEEPLETIDNISKFWRKAS